MASRRLTDLERDVYERAEAACVAWEAAGLTILVTCTYRTDAEQTALYAQGREPLTVVNTLRHVGQLRPISESENRIVTMARSGKSWHNWRRAFDVVPLVAGKPVWDAGASIWQEVGRIGEGHGLEWAGRWPRFREYPHFQYTAGLSFNDMKGLRDVKR